MIRPIRLGLVAVTSLLLPAFRPAAFVAQKGDAASRRGAAQARAEDRTAEPGPAREGEPGRDEEAAAPSDSAPPPPLYDNLGSLQHPITTSSNLPQRYFDQGLRLVYAFNHAEAIRAFEEAARLDSTAAMPHWGIALALGPNINAPMEPEVERRAYAEFHKALALSVNADERERAYIEALAARYGSEPGADRAARDSAYANAMRELSRRYPDDPDAVTLFAESLLDLRPWDQWTKDGKPQLGTLEVVATLERVLQNHPDHPGACHYYIHAVEASPNPERALPCAERLASLMPGAGHLVHMPAHIYMRLGIYDKAAEHNLHAAALDRAYIADQHPDGIYPLAYYPHNIHFLWAAATMEGRSADALKAARDLAANVPLAVVRQVPLLELWPPIPLQALVRFGRWDEVLSEPQPPSDLLYVTAIWRYARGRALTAKGRMDEARVELDSLEVIARAIPPDRIVGPLNSAADLLGIASNTLAGELAAKQGHTDEAVRRLREAVRIQDGLRYDEPEDWDYPVRQSLGAVLLEAGRAAEAEAVYREDLARNRENGWSLYGLARSLRTQGKSAAAAEVEERFRKAWATADIRLTASAF